MSSIPAARTRVCTIAHRDDDPRFEVFFRRSKKNELVLSRALRQRRAGPAKTRERTQWPRSPARASSWRSSVRPRDARAATRTPPIFARAGDEDTVTGFLLAGVGHRTADKTNFLVVKGDTPVSAVEAAFNDFTTRDDIGIVLINQHARGRRRARRRRRPETAPPPAGRERHPTSAQVVHENDPDRARDAVQGSALRPAAGLHHAARERHAQRRDVGGPRPMLSRCYTNSAFVSSRAGMETSSWAPKGSTRSSTVRLA